MWYVIIGEDAPGTLDKRMAARPAHLERFRALQKEGRVLTVGPIPAIDSLDPGPAGFLAAWPFSTLPRWPRRKPLPKPTPMLPPASGTRSRSSYSARFSRNKGRRALRS